MMLAKIHELRVTRHIVVHKLCAVVLILLLYYSIWDSEGEGQEATAG